MQELQMAKGLLPSLMQFSWNCVVKVWGTNSSLLFNFEFFYLLKGHPKRVFQAGERITVEVEAVRSAVTVQWQSGQGQGYNLKKNLEDYSALPNCFGYHPSGLYFSYLVDISAMDMTNIYLVTLGFGFNFLK